MFSLTVAGLLKTNYMLHALIPLFGLILIFCLYFYDYYYVYKGKQKNRYKMPKRNKFKLDKKELTTINTTQPRQNLNLK